jgi:pilus assembly protein CpaC
MRISSIQLAATALAMLALASLADAAATPAATPKIDAKPAASPTPIPTATPPPTPQQKAMRPQVRVEARVLEWQNTKGLDFDFAVRYQRNPGAGSVLGSSDLTLPADPTLANGAKIFLGNMNAGSGSFDAVIDTLQTAGKVRILSQPSLILTSLDVPESDVNNPAKNPPEWKKLSTGLQIPYETTRAIANRLASVTEYKDSGVTLEAAVLRVDRNLVTLDIKAAVTDVSGFISIGLNERNEPMSVPTIDSRTIQNRLLVPDRTMVIAALMKTTRANRRNQGIPWLSEIPVVNWFVSNRTEDYEDTELIFLLKPEIIQSEGLAEPEAAR